MAKEKTVDATELYEKMGRVAYLLTIAEGALRQAQAVHQQLQKQAVDIANQISQAEAAAKTGVEDADNS